ncbi:MAG: hypothetical protein Q3961_04075 [Bifidobacteriaceae bacterium]|nr:hypothetical protein [Bifidobacteriaceae bacterium]
MPWWVWLILVIFLFANITYGLIYAAHHGMKAISTFASLGNRIAKSFEKVGDVENKADEPIAFTQPIAVTGEKYTQAYAKVAARKVRARMRHEKIWDSWEEPQDYQNWEFKK